MIISIPSSALEIDVTSSPSTLPPPSINWANASAAVKNTGRLLPDAMTPTLHLAHCSMHLAHCFTKRCLNYSSGITYSSLDGTVNQYFFYKIYSSGLQWIALCPLMWLVANQQKCHLAHCYTKPLIWHCALISCTPLQFIGLFGVWVVPVCSVMCPFTNSFLDRMLFHHDGSYYYWNSSGHPVNFDLHSWAVCN